MDATRVSDRGCDKRVFGRGQLVLEPSPSFRISLCVSKRNKHPHFFHDENTAMDELVLAFAGEKEGST